jgi:hypothetical protein
VRRQAAATPDCQRHRVSVGQQAALQGGDTARADADIEARLSVDQARVALDQIESGHGAFRGRDRRAVGVLFILP